MFGKKKTKLDSKVRYQHASFTRKLELARTYQRASRPVPESTFEKFLQKIGLGKGINKILAVALLLFLIYLVYIPNFLFIKSIKITGAEGNAAGTVQAEVSEYFSKSSLLQAQKNIIFLNATGLKNYLLANNSAIFKVEGIKKNWRARTLTVKILPKAEQFFVQTNTGNYAVYNDGTIAREISTDPAQPPPAGLVKFIYPDGGSLADNQSYLRGDFVTKLLFIKTSSENTLHHQVDSFQMLAQNPEPQVQNSSPETTPPPDNASPNNDEVLKTEVSLPLHPPDIAVSLKKNNLPPKARTATFAIYLDLTGDLNTTLAKVNLLITQMDPGRYQNLFYIDMRIPDKAYICLANTACAHSLPQVIVNPVLNPLVAPTNQSTK